MLGCRHLHAVQLPLALHSLGLHDAKVVRRCRFELATENSICRLAGAPQKSANPFGRMSEHLWGEVSPLRLCCCHDVSAWSRCHISAVGLPLLVLRGVPIGVWILGGCDEVILPVSDDVARACEFSRLARFWLTFGTARTSVHGFRPPKKVFRPSLKLHVPAGAVASSMGTSGWCFSCRLLIQLRMPSASTAEVW